MSSLHLRIRIMTHNYFEKLILYFDTFIHCLNSEEIINFNLSTVQASMVNYKIYSTHSILILAMGLNEYCRYVNTCQQDQLKTIRSKKLFECHVKVIYTQINFLPINQMKFHQVNSFLFTSFNFYAFIYQMFHQKMEDPLLIL
jgi:hypothetical protein